MNFFWKACRKIGVLPNTPIRFGDAQAEAAANPYTFYAPSSRSLSQIKAGDRVKVWFEYDKKPWHDYSGERMWVSTLSRNDENFVGVLESSPLDIIGLSPGSHLEFESKNIVSREVVDPEGDPTSRYSFGCIVSASVLDGKKPVGELVREESVDATDSGWLIIGLGESIHELHQHKKLEQVSCGAVLKMDDSWLVHFNAPVGSHFLRNAPDENFRCIEAHE